jgi:prepilin-type processing-associated H-X9-DG protein
MKCSLILLSFLTAKSHGDIAKQPDCPGIVVDGNTYIGAKDDLMALSELYTAYCEFTDPPDDWNSPTVKIHGAYKCDFGILGSCQGYLVNSNYAFWDGHKFMDPHQQQQCHLITSCRQIPDVCDTRNDFSCDKGEYICKPRYDATSWCQGKVLSKTDPEPCPEQVTGK